MPKMSIALTDAQLKKMHKIASDIAQLSSNKREIAQELTNKKYSKYSESEKFVIFQFAEKYLEFMKANGLADKNSMQNFNMDKRDTITPMMQRAVAKANRKRRGGDGDPKIKALKEAGGLWVRDSKCGLDLPKPTRIEAYGTVNTNTRSDGAKKKDQTFTGKNNLHPYRKNSTKSCLPKGLEVGTPAYKEKVSNLAKQRIEALTELLNQKRSSSNITKETARRIRIKKNIKSINFEESDKPTVVKRQAKKRKTVKSAVAKANKKRRTAKK